MPAATSKAQLVWFLIFIGSILFVGVELMRSEQGVMVLGVLAFVIFGVNALLVLVRLGRLIFGKTPKR